MSTTLTKKELLKLLEKHPDDAKFFLIGSPNEDIRPVESSDVLPAYVKDDAPCWNDWKYLVPDDDNIPKEAIYKQPIITVDIDIDEYYMLNNNYFTNSHWVFNTKKLDIRLKFKQSDKKFIDEFRKRISNNKDFIFDEFFREPVKKLTISRAFEKIPIRVLPLVYDLKYYPCRLLEDDNYIYNIQENYYQMFKDIMPLASSNTNERCHDPYRNYQTYWMNGKSHIYIFYRGKVIAGIAPMIPFGSSSKVIENLLNKPELEWKTKSLKELELSSASWIADTGRLKNALEDGLES